MTLFSDESTISEEVPIHYENKVAIYDDHCDDLYAIKYNGNHETCHLDFNFQLDYASHDSYIVEFIHDATENYYERGSYASTYCNNIKFPLYVLKVLKLCLFCFLC